MKKIFLLLALTVSSLIGATQYVKVTDVNNLQSGDTIIWVSEADSMATGAFTSTAKKIDATAITIKDSVVISQNALKEIVLTKATDYWTMKIGTTALGVTSEGKDFKSSGTKTWTIDIVKGEAIVKSTVVAGGVHPKIFYNPSSRIFRPYISNTMAPIQIYRKLPMPIVPVSVEGVELNKNELTLREGNTDSLFATISPKDAKDQSVMWGSVDETVATVTNGKVAAIGVGQTKVWVKTNDGGFTDTCAITVLRAGQVVTWKQVQYVSSLVEGAQVLIGTAAKDYVLGLYDNSVAKSNIRGQEATYSQNRREVTASDLYAYTVHKDGEKFYFEGSDGKYLYMYNTNKNLSSNETLNNQAKWTVSIEDLYGEVTMKSVYSSSWQVFFNKTAESPMFCTYTSSPQTDANIAPIVFYSDKATDWVEYVPNPQLTILIDKDTVTDKIDWGQVVFDDSWGTETNPYEESKSLTFVTKDIDEDISLCLYQGTAFTLYNETVAAKGGKASIQFSVKEKGTYADTLYVQTADTLIKIYLTAQAVDPEEILPKLTLSTHAIYLNPNIDNELTAYAEMTFSVENLAKNLYIKWEKGEIPSWQNQSFVIKAGNEAAELVFGGATNMGTATRENEDILMEVYAFQSGTFVSDLCFYTYKENSKEDLAFEQRVTITVVVDNEYKPIPTDLENSRCTMHNAKYIKNGRVVIEREGRWYSILGVEE